MPFECEPDHASGDEVHILARLKGTAYISSIWLLPIFGDDFDLLFLGEERRSYHVEQPPAIS